jgi:RNA polymerase sigma-70 factor (ECF subfamily)
MEDTVTRAYLAGTRKWPGLGGATLENYSGHVKRLGTSEDDLERHGADLYLALVCGSGDPEALRVLFRHFLRPLEEHLARSGFDDVARQDVFQQMLLHLCAGDSPRILTYAGRAALSSWLRVTAVRFALQTRPPVERRGRRSHDLDTACLLADGVNPERQVATEAARPLMQAALERAVETLPGRDRTLLRLCFVDGLTVDAIGKMYGVHRATAARWIVGIRRRLLKDVEGLLARDVGLHASEFQSWVRLVRSELHLSLSRVLATA